MDGWVCINQIRTRSFGLHTVQERSLRQFSTPVLFTLSCLMLVFRCPVSGLSLDYCTSLLCCKILQRTGVFGKRANCKEWKTYLGYLDTYFLSYLNWVR
jgi:hypothetical protein